MDYYRTKIKGERVYIAAAKRSAAGEKPDEMIYRVRDGHALWGYTRADVMPEAEWLANREKLLD